MQHLTGSTRHIGASDEYGRAAVEGCRAAVKGELPEWVAAQQANPTFDRDSPHYYAWQQLLASLNDEPPF